MRKAVASVLLAGLAAMAAGPQASPPFTIQRVGGSPSLTLASYRGKIIALAFISTTCPHCQELTKELAPIAKEYEPRGVQFLECAFNDEAQRDLPGFIQQYQPPFPVGFANRDQVYSYLGRSTVDVRAFYVPHLVFIDRNGLIQGDYPGESDFMASAPANTRSELDKLLRAGAPAAAKSATSNARQSRP